MMPKRPGMARIRRYEPRIVDRFWFVFEVHDLWLGERNESSDEAWR
jgi:hypothetical protein